MLAMYLAVLDDRSSEEQFIDVYNTYKRLVYHTAYKIMGDSYLAEDVLQEVFFVRCQKFFLKFIEKTVTNSPLMKQLRSLQVLRRPGAYNSREYRVQFMRELAHGRKDKSIFKREKQWQAKLVRRMCLLNICYIVWII